MISNLVEISWFLQDVSQPSPAYIASVFLTERRTVPQLLARLTRPSAIRPSLETQRRLIRILSTQQTSESIDNDVQIATNSLRLSLDCPATRRRMRLPARAITCEHLRCFDLEGYLRMNEKKASKQYTFTLFFQTFFVILKLGFVLCVIKQLCIPSYLLINFFSRLWRNVLRMFMLLNMILVVNGLQ